MLFIFTVEGQAAENQTVQQTDNRTQEKTVLSTKTAHILSKTIPQAHDFGAHPNHRQDFQRLTLGQPEGMVVTWKW